MQSYYWNTPENAIMATAKMFMYDYDYDGMHQVGGVVSSTVSVHVLAHNDVVSTRLLRLLA